jgi:hypothetical protein
VNERFPGLLGAILNAHKAQEERGARRRRRAPAR